MTPAQFQTIEEIFLAALEQEPDQLSAFLDTACEGDVVLRREVEALLASDQRAGHFIEGSTVGLASKIIENRQAHSLVGQTIGHYKISESIGSGGMGEVYLATDIVAGRKAALKLLPLGFTGDAARLKRFQQEAHAVVALNHPNILTVYEIGEDHSIHYIASELIEGETLRQHLMRGRMEVAEAVDVAIQVTSALAAAHQAGIVHRDIKPENIMLRPDAYVKVLDFGIAKLAEEEVPATMPRDEALLLVETNLGSILGTVRYMPPEQACGAHVDKTTDIWSLGVVLYEMLTGHVPFTGDTPQDVMASILEREPPLLMSYIAHAPAELQQIIRKTLRKDRAQRYQSAHELLQALKDLRRKLEAEFERAAAPLWLRWARSPAALVLVLTIAALVVALPFYRHRTPPTSLPPEKSIAVLPFENRSRDPDNAYFADGIQDEVLTLLSKIADLKVISRTSTQHYKNASGNLREIAEQLDVAYLLEGSVQKSGDAVRVNVQLINPATDSHLWADTFDRKLTDIFGVESEIAKRIAESLQAKLTGQEEQALAVKPTNNPDAYDAYLRGLTFDARSAYSSDPMLKAIGFYERAVQLDPNFAIAWGRLSRAHAFVYFFPLDATSARRDAARKALENAQKLQPNSPETLLALGYYQYHVLRDYRLAKTTFERVSKMLPSSSEVPYALAVVTRREGLWDQSVAYFEQALALDPRNVELLMEAAWTHGMLRKFPAALKFYDRALDITPNDPEAIAAKASIYQAQGNLREAAKVLSELNERTPSQSAFITKITQLRLERNLGEAIRLLQARQAQFHFPSEIDKGVNHVWLAWTQRLNGDTAGAKVTAAQARKTLEPLCNDQPDNAFFVAALSLANAVLGEKEAALKEAERAIMLLPSIKDRVWGPALEDNLALIQMMVGENSRAISTLTRLWQTPHWDWIYGYGRTPHTPALLRLDLVWDPLRSDPRFKELVAENPPSQEKSIAVLPFENASNEPNSEYLSEGISEALINSLSQLQQLRVIARPTAFHYKRKDVDPRQVGRELGVAAVLTGKVRQMQDALNVQVDLVDPVTGAEIWGAGYDRKITDLVAVKQAIAQEVTAKLKLKLSSEDQRRLVKRDSTNAEAYQFYLRGRYFWNKRTSDGIKQAIEHFQHSIERDPNFALGYVGLADCYIGLTFYNFAAPHEAMPKAKESAIKALALDDTLAEAHATLAHILINYDWNSSAAEKEFKRSIELNPEYATAHQWYAIHFLTAKGRFEEAVQEMKKALELEPASLVMNTFMGATLYYAGRYDEAVEQCRRTLQMDPNFAVAHWHLGLAYEQKQLLDAAIEEFRKAISLSGGSPLMQAALGRAYAKAQKTHEANEMLNELNEVAKRQYASAYELATIYVALGNNEEAFQLLAKAYAEHSFHLVNLNVSPQFKLVRSDPRFHDLVQRIGLSP
jgi:TolB-like protein/Tfp pilus assembly protein PilF